MGYIEILIDFSKNCALMKNLQLIATLLVADAEEGALRSCR